MKSFERMTLWKRSYVLTAGSKGVSKGGVSGFFRNRAWPELGLSRLGKGKVFRKSKHGKWKFYFGNTRLKGLTS